MKSKAGYVWLTRRRWDGYFLPAFVLSALAALGSWWAGAAPRTLAIPLIFLPYWAAIRWQTPREGDRVRTIAGTPGTIPVLWFLGIWCVGVGIGGFLILNYAVPFPDWPREPWPPRSFQIFVGFWLVWFVGLMTIGPQIDRRYRKRRDEDELPLE